MFGWVNNYTQEVTGNKLPRGLSFLVYQDFKVPITGLNAFPEEDRPGHVNAVFQFNHIMISIGMFFITLTLYAIFLGWKGKLFHEKWLFKIFAFSVLLPQIANQVRCFTAYMGRKPWIVYGYLRINEGFSPKVSSNQILF